MPNNQKGIAHILLILTVLGIIATVLILNTFSFNSKKFSRLFVRDKSYASSQNLIKNPSFESGLTGWGSWQGTVSQANIAHSGTHSAKVAVNNDYNFYNINDWPGEVPNPQVGEIYSATAWVKGEGSTIGKPIYMTLREHNTSYFFAPSDGPSIILTADWQQITARKVIRNASMTNMDLLISEQYPYAQNGDYFYTDDITLVDNGPNPSPSPTINPTPVPIPNGVTFKPSPIPVSDPEIVNPIRGAFVWQDITSIPANWSFVDSYYRFNWSQLEKAKDQYDFSLMDSELAKAQTRGGKLGIRVMAANSTNGGSAVPQYLVDSMPKGFWFTYPKDTQKYMYVPDWNDPNFLSRAQALTNALAAKYNNDPRVGVIDIGFYGNWAEWHVSNFPYYPSPTGAIPMTTQNKKAIIDMQVKAFSNKRLVIAVNDYDAISYALSLSPNIGWRQDCLGGSEFDVEASSKIDNLTTLVDRWKKAPVMGEWCGIVTGTGGFSLAQTQIKTYHIGPMANENISSWDSFTATEQAQMVSDFKSSGYRIILDSLTIPAQIIPGTSFNVSSSWLNINQSPPYNPWNITFQLKNTSTGQVVWQGNSKLDLQILLPTTSQLTGTDNPFNVNDSFTLPNTLTLGNYDLYILITDPQSYYKPLSLAIQGRGTDGSYKLGSLTLVKDNIVPTVSITNPVNGAKVMGMMTINVIASDNMGVSKVEFYVDNILKNTIVNAPPQPEPKTYTYSWNSRTANNGRHDISAKAFDSSGNTSSSAIVKVNVSNILKKPPVQ